MILACLVLLAGCGVPRTDRPPVIRYGKDLCAECRMILGDKRFAAALVDEAGELQKFDDIGCMRMHQSHGGAAIKNFWVHDYATEEWITGKDAFFMQTDKLITPMGYGIAAFATQQAAQKFAAEQSGRTVLWDVMLEILQKNAQQTKGGNTREINS